MNRNGFVCFITSPEYDNNTCKVVFINSLDIIDKNVEHVLIHGNCTFEAVYAVNRISLIYDRIRDYNIPEKPHFYKKDIMPKFEERLDGRIAYSKMNKEQIEKFFINLVKIHQEKNIQN